MDKTMQPAGFDSSRFGRPTLSPPRRRELELVPWPKMRLLTLERRPVPKLKPDRSLGAFLRSSASNGLAVSFATALGAHLGGVPGLLMGFCVAFVVLYLAWRRG